MRGKRLAIFFGILSIYLLLILVSIPGYATFVKDYVVSGKDYTLPEDSDFDYTKVCSRDSFFYGLKSLGDLHINGSIEKTTSLNGCAAYGATGSLSIRYTYNGRYLKTKEESWHIVSDDTSKLLGYDLGFWSSIGNGCIMIEKSQNASKWEKAIEPIKDYFDKAKKDSETLIYTIPESEYQNGMYYRVVVAYKFARRTNDGFFRDDYDYKKCVEVYRFFVASEKNYISFHDMGTGSALKDQASTDSGFVLHRNGSDASVTINGNENSPDFAYFINPGEYRIDISTKLGKKYSYTINVTNGLSFSSLKPKIYESEKDKGFPLTKNTSSPAFGSHLTALSIAIPRGSNIKQDNAKYGITGKSVSLYLSLNKELDNLGKGWTLTSYSWGKKKKQKINSDIETGEIGTGALIIQTSSDGRNWKNIGKGRYQKGLYTTDYANHYGKAETVLVYTPSGQDVVKGVHIRVLFAYQVYNASKKEYRNYVEVYQFYLCSDELNAVTFHNLSATRQVNETFMDADQNQLEVYQQAESLEDGGYTVTGFKIDKKLNPTVQYTVLLNGKKVSNTRDAYVDAGKYVITLTSEVGSTREMTLYVDRMTPKEAMDRYFGNGFITDKRIFSKGEYPVFEGDETSFHIASVESNVLPLYGQIKNLSTGSIIEIEQSPDEKTGIISEPGEYQAVFTTSKNVLTGGLSGDARVFTFRFRIIPHGEAPGPVINQKLLADYNHLTVTDCNPVYYGLTFSSAGSGNITLAFASEEAAYNYAYNYERGIVEEQGNGGYRYTGSFVVSQKTKYNSNWDVNDALYYFAKAAVHKYYFDMSDEFTYLSLTLETQEEYPNLRQLELPRSVTIFAKGQLEALTDIDALPMINDKPFAYFDPKTNEVTQGFNSFEFVTDQYGGIDSKRVWIIDSAGTKHDTKYSESVGQQLLAENCPSGIVTVHEETMYGDSTEYQAVYIAPGENQTEFTIAYTHGVDNKTAVYSCSENGPTIVADSFTIAESHDTLDPYTLLIVKHNQHEDVFTVRDTIDTVWSDPGDYQITCINRMGYGYNVPVTVVDTGGKAAAASVVTNATTAPIPTQEALPAGAIEEKSSENNKISIFMIYVIAGIGIIAISWVFAHKRIRLFSRATMNMKGEGKDKHE